MQGQADGSIIIDTELNSKGFEAGSSELLVAIKALSNEIKTLNTDLKEAFSKSLTPEVNTSGAESNVSALEAHIRELEAELEQLQQASSKVGEATQTTGIGGATQKASELQRQIDAVNTSVERLEPTAQRAMSGSESAMTTFEGKAAALENKIAELQEKLETVAQTQYPTAQYEAVCSELDKLNVKFEQLMQRQEKMQALGVSEESAQWKSLQYDMEIVGAKYNDLLEKKRLFESSGTAFQLGADTTQFTQMEAVLSSASSRLAEMRAGTSKADGLMRRLGSSAASVASHIGRAARWTTSKLVSGIKSAASNMFKLLSHSKSTKKQFSGLISGAKKFTLSLLGARGVYALLRKAVSAYMAENEELTNTLKSVWSGIGNLLGPIITRLINLVSRGVAYVTQFLGLFGIYGKSTSKSVNKAASDADKLKRSLASFDELNILSDKKDTEDNSDSEKAKTSLPDVTLPDWVTQIANSIKAGDWAGAATTLATELNNMVNSVNWAGLGTKIGNLLNGVLSFLATFITTFDWQNLGAKFATFLTNLIKNVDWGNLGVLLVAKWKILLEFLSGFFENFDGKAFGDGLYNLIMGAVKACNWVEVTGNLFKNLSNCITSIDWGKLGNALSTAMRTLLQSIIAAITNFDWQGVGKSIADFINGIDWGGILSDLVTGIGELINGALELIIGFVENVDWVELAKSLANGLQNAITNLKNSNLGSNIGTAISDILKAALDFLFNFVSEIDFAALIQNIFNILGDVISNIDLGGILTSLTTLIVSLIAQIPSIIVGALGGIFDLIGSLFEACGLDGIAGFFKGIGDAMRNVGTWLKENLVDPVVNWVKNLFGIHSPSTVFAEIGGYIIQGLLNGIEAVWTKIKEFFTAAFEGLKNLISGAWEAIKKGAVAIWEAITGALKGIWNGIASIASTIWNGICKAITGIWDGIKAVWSGAGSFFSGIWSGIKNAFSHVAEWIGNIFSKAWNSVKNVWNGAKNFFSGIWNGIKNAFGAVADWFRNIFSNAWQAVKNVFSTGGKVFEGIKDGIVTAFKAVVNAIIRGINRVIAIPFNAINGLLDGIRSIDIFGIKPFSWVGSIGVPQIPELAKGGVLKKGQTGYLEGDGAEAVVPLERNTGWINRVAEQIAKLLLKDSKAAQVTPWQSIVDSFIDGFMSVTQTVIASVSNIAERSTEGIKKAVIDTGGITYDFEPFTDIAAAFKGITNMLSSMGGLKTPQIATGTVTPILNKANALLAPTDTSGLTTDFVEGVDEQLYDIIDLLRQIIEIVRALNLNIDVKALTDMVTKLQREKARNYGGV